MKKIGNNDETLREKFRNFPAVAKLYFAFKMIAILLAASICGIFVSIEPNALDALAKTTLVFSLTYIFIVSVVVGTSSRYNQERNIIAGIIPILMTTVGLILSYWLYDSYLGDRLNFGSIIIAILTIAILPVITSYLGRALSLTAWKLYFLSLMQIIISAAIAWLEFTLFI